MDCSSVAKIRRKPLRRKKCPMDFSSIAKILKKDIKRKNQKFRSIVVLLLRFGENISEANIKESPERFSSVVKIRRKRLRRKKKGNI